MQVLVSDVSLLVVMSALVYGAKILGAAWLFMVGQAQGFFVVVIRTNSHHRFIKSHDINSVIKINRSTSLTLSKIKCKELNCSPSDLIFTPQLSHDE